MGGLAPREYLLAKLVWISRQMDFGAYGDSALSLMYGFSTHMCLATKHPQSRNAMSNVSVRREDSMRKDYMKLN